MNIKITSILLALVIGGSTVAWAASRQPSGEVVAASGGQGVALAECNRTDVVLGADLPSAAISRSAAEGAAGAMGVRGAADIAILSAITIGTRADQIPSASTALHDGLGMSIVDRPAWILVFRNQSVPTPGGIPPKGGATRVQSAASLTVLAAVIDAQSGDFLRGWGCAFPK